MSHDRYAERRATMVATQIAAWGDGPSRPEAMRTVPREAFVPPELAECAYDDMPLPIGEGQTISQPSIVALMTAALRPSPTDRVLEIGTGSGCCRDPALRMQEVYTVERLEKLYRLARRRLRRLGYHHVTVHHGNGTLGWPAHASTTASWSRLADQRSPRRCREQLALGGRLGCRWAPSPRSRGSCA